MNIRRIIASLRSAARSTNDSGTASFPDSSRAPDGALLAGKTALITGAGRNIGRSTAIEMATQGAAVFFTDSDSGRCCELEKLLRNYQGTTRGFVSDISKKEDNDSLFAYFVENGITPDILVNNVGINSDEFLKTFRTNVFGPMQLTGLFIRLMVEKNVPGSIIFITSIHQEIPRGAITYSSSKAALEMIIKELALDVAPHGIRVNGIAPGYVAEDEHGVPVPHEYTPLYRTSVSPRHIGRAAVYLASDFFSRYTTGTTIKIDAGLSLVNYFSIMWHNATGRKD